MYKKDIYHETDKLGELICENYPMVLVTSRFGITPGFGDKTIGEVCKLHDVDTATFLLVVNFLIDERRERLVDTDKQPSIASLMTYLHRAHTYFLHFRLPHIRRKLVEATADCPEDVAFVICRFFDEYVDEVHKHMTYEEKQVFPYVSSLLKGEKPAKYSIAIFRKRHDQIELKITELKNILLRYYPGKGGDLLNSVLFDIFSTEQDLASHNHVEDLLFVPAVQQLEKRLNIKP